MSDLWEIRAFEERDAKRTASDPNRRTFIYFFVSGERSDTARFRVIKIGLSTDPHRRLKQIQSQFPFRVFELWSFPGDAILERDLHRRFGRLRLNGEWFRFEPEIARWLGAVHFDAHGTDPMDGWESSVAQWISSTSDHSESASSDGSIPKN